MLLLPACVQVGMRQRHQAGGVAHVRSRKENCCVPHLARIRHAGVSCRVAAIGAETALAILQINVFDFPGADWRLWGALPFCARCCFQYAAAGLAFVC